MGTSHEACLDGSLGGGRQGERFDRGRATSARSVVVAPCMHQTSAMREMAREASSLTAWGAGGRYALRLVFLIALLTAPSNARADSAPPTPDPFTWDAGWSHANAWDYTLTGIGVAGVALYLPLLQSRQPTLEWTRPILFDTAVRNLLNGSPAVESAAGTASWVLLGGVVAYPFADVAYVWKRDGPRVAWDLFWQDATALSLATAVDLYLRDVVGRARPPVSECLMKGGSRSECLGSDTEATRSFPGGHQLIVTTAASLTCTQHLEMHLYGGPWDVVACATAASTAFGVGVLRIVADAHWASDILVGDLLGVGFGWGIPTLMHVHGHAPSIVVGGARLTPIPVAVPGRGGMGVTGFF
jgi:membrane-associated phospholipid phosphatase